MKKQSILQRLANTLAERMTWDRDKEEFCRFIQDIEQCFLRPSSIHLYKWVRVEDRIKVLLHDLVTGESAWSNNGEEKDNGKIPL